MEYATLKTKSDSLSFQSRILYDSSKLFWNQKSNTLLTTLTFTLCTGMLLIKNFNQLIETVINQLIFDKLKT